MRKIVIAEDEPITMMDMQEILLEANYNVVGTASDGIEAIEICRRFKPDLVLMDIKMPLLNGIKASKYILKENLAGSVVLISAYSDKKIIDQAKELGVMGYLVKPINDRELLPTLEIALSNSMGIKAMQEKLNLTLKKLEERKIIERAKGILMNNKKISEEEAYNEIRELSMNKRISMANLSRLLIE